MFALKNPGRGVCGAHVLSKKTLVSGVFPCALSKTLMRVVLAVVALKKALGGTRVDWVRSQKPWTGQYSTDLYWRVLCLELGYPERFLPNNLENSRF